MQSGGLKSGRWPRRSQATSGKCANDALANKRERDRAVRDEIENAHGQQLRAIDHIIFALEQHGLFMLERIDKVEEDEHTPVRSALALVHSAATITVQEIRHLALQGYWVGWRGG
jgi:hypothetical protein